VPVALPVGSRVEETEFVISIPGKSREHRIPASCVRLCAEAVIEASSSYANLLGISAASLQLWEFDLSAQLAAIRKEFSETEFREEVLADAADFTFPADVHVRDVVAYAEAGRSVGNLVRAMQASKRSDRFNKARCDAVFHADPEYARLTSLAVDGVIIDVPEDLVLQSVPEPPRKLQEQLDPVYRKHSTKVWARLDGIILPQDVLSIEDRAKLHFNPAHLTRKPGTPVAPGAGMVVPWDYIPAVKMGSRFLMDCSNSESGQVLNTPAVKDRVIERFGVLSHPTISEMVTDWYKYAEEQGVLLSQCRLFKDDFSGAFTQMDVNPESAYLLAMAIGGGLVLIYLTGHFGWLQLTGTPLSLRIQLFKRYVITSF
jgi:hypothetical protein